MDHTYLAKIYEIETANEVLFFAQIEVSREAKDVFGTTRSSPGNGAEVSIAFGEHPPSDLAEDEHEQTDAVGDAGASGSGFFST